MRRLKLLGVFMTAILLTACGSSSNDTATDTVQESGSVADNTGDINSENEQTASIASAVEMKEQGNPTSIYLADIMETSNDAYAAWIKISTQFDSELSMYSYDTMATGTEAIVVEFTVKDFDETEATLYWGYQLSSGGTSFSVWDGTSPADTLTITEDGSYKIVFDAEKALGGPIETIESFQLVFPAQSETTTTKVSVTKVYCITDTADLENVSTGKAE